MCKTYKNNYHCEFLHSQTSQQCLKVLDENWKSYFASTKDYNINPYKYTGKPRPPKFKNNINKNEIIELINKCDDLIINKLLNNKI